MAHSQNTAGSLHGSWPHAIYTFIAVDAIVVLLARLAEHDIICHARRGGLAFGAHHVAALFTLSAVTIFAQEVVTIATFVNIAPFRLIRANATNTEDAAPAWVAVGINPVIITSFLVLWPAVTPIPKHAALPAF